MSRPTSAVDLCNLALGELGAKVISSITTPKTAEESVCARRYDATRRAVLRMHIWNFAKRRVLLPRSGAPAFDFTDQYPLPNDYIRFADAKVATDGDIGKDDYDIADGFYMANAGGVTGVQFSYIYDHDTIAKWDPLFLRLFVLYLAKDMSYELTRKSAVKESILSEINLIEGRVRGIDGQERPPIRREYSKFLGARSSRTDSSRLNGIH